MTFQVVFSVQTIEQLKRLDQKTARCILRWVENHLEQCENPRRHGKGFAGGESSVWRYTIGQHRFMAQIQDVQRTVVLVWLGSEIEIGSF